MHSRPIAIAMLLLSCACLGQGFIEVPAPGSNQSGVGVVSGWHCTARRIEIRIDDNPLFLAGSGTERGDTKAICGHANTGFSLLFNWNLLPTSCFGCRFHRVEAFADGVSFGSVTFNVANFGAEYLTGKGASYSLPNFPAIGSLATLQWDETMQNFAVNLNSANALSVNGTYYGALITGPQNPACGPFPPGTTFPVTHASFVVGFSAGRLSFTANYADGGTCQLSPAAVEPFDGNNRDGFVTATFDQAATAACPEFPGGLKVLANGQRLIADSMDMCRRAHVTGAK